MQDLRYALRMMRRSPGFTAVAVLSVALGIGANTAIFSLLDAMLLRALPVERPEELFEISRAGGGTVSYPLFRELGARSRAFSGLLVTTSVRSTTPRLGAGGEHDARFCAVSGGYFRTLGVGAALGRTLGEEDLAEPQRIVLAHGFWERAFGRDPAVIGKP